MNKKFLSKTLAIVIAISFILSNSAMLIPQKAEAIMLPDLKATKTNDLGGANAIVNVPFNWIIKVENIGTADATFNKNDSILEDNMPSDGVSSYGTVSTFTSAGVIGLNQIECKQNGIQNKDLNCKVKNESVTIPVGDYILFTVQVTPDEVTTLTNPTGRGSHCTVDLSGKVHESNETNNDCSNSVKVISAPVCGNGIKEGIEKCDGEDCCDADCTFKSSGTECRAASGACDVAETCNGSSASCPVDGFQLDGTSCDDGSYCNGAETCASGQCVQGNLVDCSSRLLKE